MRSKKRLDIKKNTICRLSTQNSKPSKTLFSFFKKPAKVRIAKGVEPVKDWFPVLVSVKLIDGLITDDYDQQTIVWVQK